MTLDTTLFDAAILKTMHERMTKAEAERDEARATLAAARTMLDAMTTEATLAAALNAIWDRRELAEATKRVAVLEAALRNTAVNLMAAISLLEVGDNKVLPSNKMFEQMLTDYRNCLTRALAALEPKP